MGIMRKTIKQTAKNGLAAARPHPVPVTLVYLLLTTGLSVLIPGILLAISGGEDAFYWMAQGYSAYDIMYYYLGTAGTTALVFANILIGLFTTVLSFGYTGYALGVSRGQRVGWGNLLDGFGLAGRVILLNLLTGIFVALWSLLFVIPGIIASYRYRMAVFILLDNPECGALQAIRMSKDMMKGHKMDLFVFDLSFANWLVPFIVVGVASVLFSEISYLLGAASILVLSGAVSLWVIPFVLTSQAVFYDTLRGGGTGRPQSGRYSGPEANF